MNPLHKLSHGALVTVLLFALNDTEAAPAGFIYNEAEVPEYTLPDPLLAIDGSKVKTAKQWTSSRRNEILKLFETEVYGRRLAEPDKIKFELTSIQRDALGGKAIRKQVTISFESEGKSHPMHVLLYLPTSTKKKVPVFLGYNFEGNHSIDADPSIDLPSAWMRWAKNHRAREKDRGESTSRWPLESILNRGYGLVTVYYGDIEADHAEGWKNGIRGKFKKDKDGNALALKDSSAISAWAWGLSRVMDYLETDRNVDAKQVAIIGHSRLGKTSLWAGASDERFAITISNDSGCGGAALSRRTFGETVKRINTKFPHWFCGNFKNYNDKESNLSIDQHELIALMAPRPVYVASAEKDLWADPHGEFIAAEKAGVVYQLFGKTGVGVKEQPEVNHPVGDYIGYHMRTGKHDVTDFDWNAYLNFADRQFKHEKDKKRQALINLQN